LRQARYLQHDRRGGGHLGRGRRCTALDDELYRLRGSAERM
jgi:hypothetical protein